MTEETALESLRRLVLSDPELQARLAAIETGSSFAQALRQVASQLGHPIPQALIEAAIRPDPLGISRLDPLPPQPGWPPPGWLPAGLVETRHGTVVDWAHFGPGPLLESFFAGSARRAIDRPFNRLFRWQTPIADFVAAAEPAPLPRGLVFHWSRCGSTLVSRFLARLPGAICLSEAAPIDAAVRIGDPALLRAMAAAFARSSEIHFLKLHCWHMAAWPLFRAAFPGVPWLFLFRDPLEILVSHGKAPSPDTHPSIVPPERFGMPPEAAAEAEYEARVLARIAAAAIAAGERGEGLFVDYRSLPGAIIDRILPHFAIAAGARERALLETVASADAKRPDRPFVADGAAKRSAATTALEETAHRHLGAPYHALAGRA